jgi:hypothetical protein
MDLNQLLQIEETVLLWTFIGIIIILVLAFLRGLLRGWRYGTYRLGFFLIFIICSLCFLDPIASGIGGIDLSPYLNGYTLSFSVNNTSIMVPVTTIFATIKETMRQLLVILSPSLDPTQITTLATGLATSLIKFLSVFLLGIIFAIFGNLLALLLWHIAFKHIIPKENRKASYKKGKLWSAFEELIIAGLLISMIVLPVTSVVNSVARGFNKVDDEQKEASLRADNSTYNIVSSAVDTYDNSILGKLFYNSKDDNNNTFDVNLMDFLTNFNFNDTSISLIKEVKNFSNIATLLVDTGVLSQEGSNASKTVAVLTSEYSPKLISALTQSPLIMNILPFAFDLATNLDQVKQYLAVDWNIDYFSYDWGETIENLSSILKGLQDSGVLGGLYDNNGQLAYNTDDLTNIFTDENIDKITGYFDSLFDDNDGKNIVNELLLAYVASTVVNTEADDTKLSLVDFFPSAADFTYTTDQNTGRKIPTNIPTSYANIDFSKEVGCITKSLGRLIKIDSSFFGLAINGLITNDFDVKSLTSLVIDNVDTVSSCITGVNSDGTFTLDEDGTSADNNCLLDSSFIINAMPKFLKLFASTASTSLNATIDLTSVSTELYGDSTNPLSSATKMSNTKHEVNALLTVASDFAKTTAGKNFLKNTDSLPGITFDKEGNFHTIDDDLLDALIGALTHLDDSKIASAILPSVFSSVLGGESGALSSFGITELNFNVDNLGTELSNLLSTYKSCKGLFSYVMGMQDTTSSSDASSLLNGLRPYVIAETGKTPQLLTLLNYVSNSKILNPTTDKEGNDITNQNYVNILNSLLKTSLGEDYTYTGDPKNLNLENENTAFVSFVGQVIDSGALSLLSASSLDLSSLSSISFKKILAPLDDSEILSTVFSKYLDEKILPSLLGDDTTSDVKFSNITDWSGEGDALNSLLKFASEVGDLANIDFLNSDPVAIENIINVLSSNQLFDKDNGDGTTTYVFSTFIYKKIVSSIDSSTIKYFEDRNATGTSNVERTSQMGLDFARLSKADWENESSVFGDIVRYISQIGGLDAVSGTSSLGDINPETVRLLLKSIASSESVGRVVSYHLYGTLVNTFVTAGLSLGDLTTDYGNANLDYLWNLYNYGENATAAEMTAKRNARIAESEVFSNILTAVTNTTYGLLDNGGHVDSAKASIETASPTFLLQPILHNMSQSYIFNSLSSDNENVTATTPTAFESELSSLLETAGVYASGTAVTYVTSVASGSGKLDNSSTLTARYEAWSDEVDNIVQIAQDLQTLSSSGFSLATFNLSTFFSEDSSGNTLSEADALNRRSLLNNLLDSINQSEILYHALPTKMSDAITGSSTSLGGISLSNANCDYNNGARYGEDELENLTYILYDCGRSSFSTTDLSALDPTLATDLLARMASSHVFNSLADGKTGLTVFQSAFSSVISSSQLSSLYFNATNPKDGTSTTYNSAASKAEANVTSLFPSFNTVTEKTCSAYKAKYCKVLVDDTANDSYVSFRELLTTITDLGSDTLTEISNNNLSALNVTDLVKILKSLNDNEILTDCVPNAISSFTTGSALSSLSSSGFTLSRVNPFYSYFENNGVIGEFTTANAHYDFAHRMDDNEIEQLGKIIKELSDNQGLFANSFSTLTSDSLLTIRTLLLDLSSSKVFHEAGAWNGLNSTITDADLASETIFEQAMYNVIDKSGLSDRAYNQYYDSGSYTSASNKLHTTIKNITNNTGSVSHAGDWTSEINALVCNEAKTSGLLFTAFDSGLISGGLNFASLDFSDPSKTSIIQEFALAINSVDTIKDIIPYEMDNFLNNTFKFDTYSMVNDVTYTINQTGGTYSTLTSIGDVGAISTFKIDATGSYTLKYGYISSALTTYQTLSGSQSLDWSRSSSTPIKPLYLVIELGDSSTLNSLTLSFNTAHTFLSQSEYAISTSDGPIGSLVAFANSMKSGNQYIDFSSTSLTSLVSSHISTAGILHFVAASDGFYMQSAYDVNYKTLTNTYFYGRDVILNNLLKFSTTINGISASIDLGRYFDLGLNKYQGMATAFSNITSLSDEGSWLDNNVMTLAGIDYFLGSSLQDVTKAYTVLGTNYSITLPRMHVQMEALAADSSHSFTSFLTANVSSASKFARCFADGTLLSFIEQVGTYGSSNYFKGVAYDNGTAYQKALVPDTKVVRNTAVSSEMAKTNHGFTSKALSTNTSLISVLKSVLDETGGESSYGILALLSGSTMPTSSVVATLVGYDSLTDADTIELAKYLYAGTTYECFVNRSLLTTMPNDDYPNPWATGFNFTKVSVAIA